MGWDIIFVVAAIAAAAWFLGRRLYRTVAGRAGCSCDCEKSSKCSGACSSCAAHEEIRRKSS